MNELWQSAAELQLGSKINAKRQLGGGDFAESYQASLEDGRTVFVKTHKNPPPGFFTTEAAGLTWLRASNTVNVPDVLAVSDEPPFLALEWVDLGSPDAQTERLFGEQLAQMHALPFECFGRPDGATTGSQAVPNDACSNWPEFYSERRLLPLCNMASKNGALSNKCISNIETLSGKLSEFGASDEHPSLLHGDLWAGNRVVDTEAQSWLIDPAVHGGHREFDLSMMQLFGGYGHDCIEAYQAHFPLQDGWQDRVALHQLAPLIVHAIKFGGSYRAATQNAVSQYV